MKKCIWKWTVACFMMLLAMYVCGIATFAAGETITVGVTCTYGQSEAREMLGMINEFRTGGTAWYWDEGNTTKVPCTSLSDLKYDYGLEQAAMQRAAEIALAFDHTRPNGDSCFTGMPESAGGTIGENIAAGNTSAESAFTSWKEENEKYAGQGHRRNMLSSSFQYIGIGHVVYNGCHYWVQEFSGTSTGTQETTETDAEKTVPVEVSSSYIINKSVTASLKDITLTYGDMADLPKITCEIQLTETWPERLCPVTLADLSNVWTVSGGTDCISIDTGTGRISADKTGEAQIEAEVWDQLVAVPVTVTPKNLTGAELTLDESQLTYNGSPITPSVTLSLDGKELKADTDYTVEYENNINAGTASVKVSGTGNYIGIIAKTFEIASAGIKADDCTFAEEKDGYVYTGEQIRPAVVVQHDGRTLIEEKDYTVYYETNIDAGRAGISVTGEGNYSGTVLHAFMIRQASLTEDTSEIDPIPNQEYARAELTPAVTVRWNGRILEQGKDYAAIYKNNQDVGTAQVEIQGMGNFTDGYTTSFEITKANLEKGIATVKDQIFTGAALTPEVAVSLGGVSLEEDTDYIVERFDNNTDAGEASVTVAGTGNYTGTLTGEFTILPLSITGTEFTLGEIAAETYSGAEIRPSVVLYRDGKALEDGTDYSVAYENNTNAGTADVTVTGTGNYSGTKATEFQILPLDLGGCSVSAKDQVFTGRPIEPPLEVTLNGSTLVSGTDYTVSYDGVHTDVGTVSVSISGKENYSGTAAGSFEILQADMEDCQVSGIAEHVYTGYEILPDVTVSLGDYVLTAEDDYMIEYADNINIGEAGIILTGKGNFAGKQHVTFKIVPIDLSKAVLGDIPAQTYTGAQITPAVTVSLDGEELKEGTDYTVDYWDNIDAGTAAVTVTGTGNYTGTLAGTFEILKKQTQPDQGTSAAPDSQTSDTSTAPNPQTPGKPVDPTSQGSSLAKGTVKKDSTSAAKYKIKGTIDGVVTVEYVAPVSKKKTSVMIPDTVKINGVRCKVVSVAANAFKNNTKIKKVTIGKYVTSIGKNAFQNCTRMKSLKIGANVTAINEGAFYGCTSLTSVTIPSRVTKIGRQAFYHCSKLKTITVKTKKLTQKTVGKKAFSKINSRAVIKVPGSKKKAYNTIFKKSGVSKKVKIK